MAAAVAQAWRRTLIMMQGTRSRDVTEGRELRWRLESVTVVQADPVVVAK
jgi:hypothetical protein